MRLLALPLLAILGGIVTPAATAADNTETSPVAATGSGTSASVSEKDVKFIRHTHQGLMAGVKSSEAVLKRGLTGADRDFAQKVVQMHQGFNSDLSDLARKKGVTLPDRLDEKMQEKNDKLLKTKDADLAERYLECQIDGHKEAVSAFKDAIENSKDSDIRAFAAKYMPTMQAHLDEAKRLEAAH